MNECLVLTRRRMAAALAILLACGTTGSWSKDGDSGGGSGGGDSGGGGSGSGDSGGGGSGKSGSDDRDDDNGGHGRGGDDDADHGDGDDRGDDDSRDRLDHDYARRGVARGELVPLAAILQRVRSERPGRVVKVDLLRQGRTGAVYRVVVIGERNERWQVFVDARRNSILKTRRH